MPPPAGPGCTFLRPAPTHPVLDAPAPQILAGRERSRRDHTLTLTVVVTITSPSAAASSSTTVPAALGIMSDITPTPTPRSPVDEYPAVNHISANGSPSTANPSSLALRSGLAGGGAALLGTIIIAGILLVFHRIHRNRCKAFRPRNPEPERRHGYGAVTPYPYGDNREDTLPVFHSKRVSLIFPSVDINSRPPTYYSNTENSPLPVQLPLPATARTRSRSFTQSVRRSHSAPIRVDLRSKCLSG
ncbi:hypothetical protein C8Q73DRAFT_711010 [Cubamyces lactineus]|nr:hypothetical protein C8Q73DRAFT_711010 [Cubamyces lactineus]